MTSSMNTKDSLRLTRVEDKQVEMTQQIAELRADMKANTIVTNTINSKLDNLSGGKQALMWIMGFLVLAGTMLATFVAAHRK